MASKLLNGAASPANCARKIAGPFIVAGICCSFSHFWAAPIGGGLLVRQRWRSLDAGADPDGPAVHARLQDGMHDYQHVRGHGAGRAMRRSMQHRVLELGYT